MGFAELIVTSLIRISAWNPQFRHYVTLATPRVVPVRRVKAFIWRKVVPLARVTLPAEVRQLAHPSCLAPPRRVCNPNVNGLLVLQRNKLKVTSTRVTRGEGCLGHPRPCKWGLSLIVLLAEVRSAWSLVSAELTVVWKFAVLFSCKSTPQTFIRILSLYLINRFIYLHSLHFINPLHIPTQHTSHQSCTYLISYKAHISFIPQTYRPTQVLSY